LDQKLVWVFFLYCIYNSTQMYAWMGLELVWEKYHVRMNSIALSVEKSAENRCTSNTGDAWPRVPHGFFSCASPDH
jgi:hypothetical protein